MKDSDITRLYQLAQNYNTYMPATSRDIRLGNYDRGNDTSLSALAQRIIMERQLGNIPSRNNPIYINGRWGYDAGYKPINYTQLGWGMY